MIQTGGRISYQPIGASEPMTAFTGAVTISGTVIELTGASSLESFISDGLAAGQMIDIAGTGGADDGGPYKIESVTATRITLAGGLPASGTFAKVSISRIVNHGIYSGAVIYNAKAGTLTRADGSSWLADGFLEGQLFQINGGGALYKIQLIGGTEQGLENVLEVTPAAFNAVSGTESVMALPFTGTGEAAMTLREWAPQITYTSGNWWVPVQIPVLADPYYTLAPGQSELVKFPKIPHLLSHILGPLQIEGASTAGNNFAALQLPVMLPHEKNTEPFGLPTQPPEAQQVNVLNIYDDGAQEDTTGTLSSTTLSGFNMGGELNFTHHKGYEPGNPDRPTFGEPAVIPGGISFASLITKLSTVQVFNFMMGQGNDHLTVTGSLFEGPFTYENGTPGTTFVQGGISQIQGGGAAYLSVTSTPEAPFEITAGSITRKDGLPWASEQFAVGQELMWNGTPFGMITEVSGATLKIAGAPPVTGSAVVGTLAVFGPQITSSGAFTFSGQTITRGDLLDWAQFGFAVGQQITVDGRVIGTIQAIEGPTGDVLKVSGTLPVSGGTVAVYNAAQSHVALGGNEIIVTGRGPGTRPHSADGRRELHRRQHRRGHRDADPRERIVAHRRLRIRDARPDQRRQRRHGQRTDRHDAHAAGLEPQIRNADRRSRRRLRLLADGHLRQRIAERRLVQRRTGCGERAQLRLEALPDAARQRLPELLLPRR